MENNKNKNFEKLVNNIKVEGKTYKEFTINYLKTIIETYKNLSTEKRFQSYIEYFVNNFSYDKLKRDETLNSKTKTETKDYKEKILYDLFSTNKGVCEQFSVGFALLCKMDKEIEEKYDIYVADCSIETSQKMAHCLNIINTSKGLMLLDLSAMIHCKEKDNVGEIWDYGPVLIDKYIENQKRNNFKIISNGPDARTYLLVYRNNTSNNVGEYYDLLTQPAEVLNTNLRKQWFTVDISSCFEEQYNLNN